MTRVFIIRFSASALEMSGFLGGGIGVIRHYMNTAAMALLGEPEWNVRCMERAHVQVDRALLDWDIVTLVIRTEPPLAKTMRAAA